MGRNIAARRRAWGIGMTIGLLLGVTGAVAAPAALAAPEYAVTRTIGPDSTVADRVLAVDPTTHTLYSAESIEPYRGERVYTLRAETAGTLGASVLLPDRPRGIAVDTGDHAVWVLGQNALRRYRGGALVDTTPVPTGTVAIVGTDPVAHEATLWVAADAGPELQRVRDGRVVGTTALGGGPVWDLALDTATGAAWTVTQDGSVVVRRAGAVVAQVDVGAGPGRIGVDPKTHTAYVTLPGQNAVALVRDGRVVARVGGVPRAGSLAIDPTTGTAFVAPAIDSAFFLYGSDHSVYVIRDGALAGAALVSTSGGPGRLAVDTASGTLYAQTYQGISVLTRTTAPAIAVGGPAYEVPLGAPYRPKVTPYVLFTQPMDRAATSAALRVDHDGLGDLDPALHLEWLSDTAAIVVGDRLTRFPGRILLSFTEGARSTDGQPLTGARGWEFYVTGLSTALASPAAYDQAVSPDAPVVITFTGGVDKASVEQAFRLVARADDGTESAVAGRFGWFGDRVLVFVPDAPLARGTLHIPRLTQEWVDAIGDPHRAVDYPSFDTY